MKKTLTRRDFLKVTGAGIAGAAFVGSAGCGGNQSNQSNGKVTLTWWDYYQPDTANGTAMKAELKRYMKSHPNVTVKRRSIPFANLKQQLLQGASAGELPDIAVIDNPDVQSFAELGAITDVTDRVKKWGQADSYFDGPWKSTMYKSKNYGIPDNSNCLTLWYNKDLLKKAGLQPPTNWDELKNTAKKLTTNDHFGLAVSAVKSEEGTFQWLPFLWQSGADIGNIDSPGGRAALQLWVDMVRENSMSRGILGWTQEDVKNQFVNRRAAMMINGPWQIPVVKESAPDLNWDIVVLPKGKQKASILGGEDRTIMASSKNADAAWDLLTWTQKPNELKKYLIQAGKLPSRQTMADEPHWSKDPVLSVFVEQLKVAKPRAYGAKYPQISNAIQNAIQAAISGQSNVETALSQAQKTITSLLPK